MQKTERKKSVKDLFHHAHWFIIFILLCLAPLALLLLWMIFIIFQIMTCQPECIPPGNGSAGEALALPGILLIVLAPVTIVIILIGVMVRSLKGKLRAAYITFVMLSIIFSIAWHTLTFLPAFIFINVIFIIIAVLHRGL